MGKNLRDAALELLDANTIEAERESELHRFAIPTSDTGVNAYRIPKFQWTGWDSQFHAIVYSTLGRAARARQELDAILANQRRDGFIPHVTFWGDEHLPTWAYLESRGRLNRIKPFRPATSEHIQPPLLAESLSRVAEVDPTVLGEHLPAVARYYQWLAEHRDPDEDGLISVIAQAETGLDYSPSFDAVIGYHPDQPARNLHTASRRVRRMNKWLWNFNLERIFRQSPWHVEDVLVNSIYIRNLGILRDLANVKRETSLTSWASERYNAGLNALLEKSFDAEIGLFWNLRGNEEEQIRTKTIGSLMPLIIPDLPDGIAERLVGHLTNPDEFWTKYPIPSTALNEPAFTPDNIMGGELRIWRGPLSMNTNWYLIHGLRQHGYDDIAEEITRKSHSLTVEHGFNEFYNPLSGQPCGADRFGWATLVVDM